MNALGFPACQLGVEVAVRSTYSTSVVLSRDEEEGRSWASCRNVISHRIVYAPSPCGFPHPSNNAAKYLAVVFCAEVCNKAHISRIPPLHLQVPSTHLSRISRHASVAIESIAAALNTKTCRSYRPRRGPRLWKRTLTADSFLLCSCWCSRAAIAASGSMQSNLSRLRRLPPNIHTKHP